MRVRIGAQLRHAERQRRAGKGMAVAAGADEEIGLADGKRAALAHGARAAGGDCTAEREQAGGAKKLAAAGRDHRPLPTHSGRASSAGRLSATSTINWPNSAFAHANQLRVKFFGSSLWKLSCMKPVPPCVVFSQRRHWRIVASSSAFIAREIGRAHV